MCGRRLRGEPVRISAAQHEDQRRGWRLGEIGGAEDVKVLHERGILDLRKFERDRPHFLDWSRSAFCRTQKLRDREIAERVPRLGDEALERRVGEVGDAPPRGCGLPADARLLQSDLITRQPG